MRRINGHIAADRDIADENTQLSAPGTGAARARRVPYPFWMSMYEGSRSAIVIMLCSYSVHNAELARRGVHSPPNGGTFWRYRHRYHWSPPFPFDLRRGDCL